MTPKEQTRLQVLNSLLVEHMTLDQAATLMGVSPRHTRRILADYRKNGAASLAHGHRGRKPANAIPEATRSRVVHLARTVYEGANHTHLSELLSERVGLDMGRTTLRRILVNAGLSSPRRRRPPKHRVRRQRMPRQGMLIQMDGSHHPWLGDRMLPFTLLIAVDDATGTVVDALFCEKEDAHSYFLLIQRLLQRRGIPLALYTDRHGVFRHTPGSGLPGMPTQFSRAMDELRIQMIFAPSPQAKGSVERMAETFQDRLVTELRLAGASSIEEANSVLEQFLPRFNRRFRVPPQYPEPAFRPLDPELCLEQILCSKHRRKVAKDNTVRFQLHTLQLHTLQLLPGRERPSYAGAAGEVLERLDGGLSVRQRRGLHLLRRRRAEDGTRVSAEVDGVEAKTGTTREGKYGYDTGDLFRVDGAAGDGVVFKVNGVVAEETGVFKSGGSTELNLSATQTAGDPLIDRYDANGNGKIDKKEVIKAINDYLFGEGDEAISKGDVIRLINLYLFG